MLLSIGCAAYRPPRPVFSRPTMGQGTAKGKQQQQFGITLPLTTVSISMIFRLCMMPSAPAY